MSISPEHQFIAESLGQTLQKFSETALFGITESQRKTFDYSCVLLRDFSRPLVSQVLWSHSEGIEKDLRTLLFDAESLLKVYLVKDNLRNCSKIEEVISSYKSNPKLRVALGGLKLIRLPAGFDADAREHRKWMSAYIHQQISHDILFNVVFGKLTLRDLEVFAQHGGASGLRFLILDELECAPLDHMPTFKERIGYRTTGTIDRALTMLNALNFIKTFPMSNVRFISLKGRLLLDLTRLLLFEMKTRQEWSEGVAALLAALNLVAPKLQDTTMTRILPTRDTVLLLLYDAYHAKAQFGRDLLRNVDLDSPRFYSSYRIPDVERYSNMPGFSRSFFSEPDTLFFVG